LFPPADLFSALDGAIAEIASREIAISFCRWFILLLMYTIFKNCCCQMVAPNQRQLAGFMGSVLYNPCLLGLRYNPKRKVECESGGEGAL
jgi:hypothetical protein